MCVLSMVGDYYTQKWQDLSQITITSNPLPISKEDFDNLKKEVMEMKELLKRAKIYDEQTGQKDCEIEEKIQTLKRIAKYVGIDLEEIFKAKCK